MLPQNSPKGRAPPPPEFPASHQAPAVPVPPQTLVSPHWGRACPPRAPSLFHTPPRSVHPRRSSRRNDGNGHHQHQPVARAPRYNVLLQTTQTSGGSPGSTEPCLRELGQVPCIFNTAVLQKELCQTERTEHCLHFCSSYHGC